MSDGGRFQKQRDLKKNLSRRNGNDTEFWAWMTCRLAYGQTPVGSFFVLLWPNTTLAWAEAWWPGSRGSSAACFISCCVSISSFLKDGELSPKLQVIGVVTHGLTHTLCKQDRSWLWLSSSSLRSSQPFKKDELFLLLPDSLKPTGKLSTEAIDFI